MKARMTDMRTNQRFELPLDTIKRPFLPGSRLSNACQPFEAVVVTTLAPQGCAAMLTEIPPLSRRANVKLCEVAGLNQDGPFPPWKPRSNTVGARTLDDPALHSTGS